MNCMKKSRKRTKIRCPKCTKMIAERWWAPGYPGLYPHKNWSGEPCISYFKD